MWKKVLYVGIAVILGIVIFFVAFISNQTNYVYDVVGSAITEQRYSDVIKMFNGGYFDTNSMVTDESDKLDIVVHPATTLSILSYGEDKSYNHCENAYFISIFNPTYDIKKADNRNDWQSGLRFNGDERYYDYYFMVNDKYNSSSYIAEPQTLTQAVLNGKKELLLGIEDRISFVNVTLTKVLIDEIKIQLESEIQSFSVIDRNGEVVETYPINFDFSSPYFNDMKSFVDYYDDYLQKFFASGDDNDKKQQLNSDRDAFIDDWRENTFKGYVNDKKYAMCDGDTSFPSSILWQTIGIEALYLLIVVMFYIVLFHFQSLRSLFSKDSHKEYGKKKSDVYVNGQKVEHYKSTKETKNVKQHKDVIDELPADSNVNQDTVEPNEVEETPLVEELPVVEETPVVDDESSDVNKD